MLNARIEPRNNRMQAHFKPKRSVWHGNWKQMKNQNSIRKGSNRGWQGYGRFYSETMRLNQKTLTLFMDGGTRWFPPSSPMKEAEQYEQFFQNHSYHIWIERSFNIEHEYHI